MSSPSEHHPESPEQVQSGSWGKRSRREVRLVLLGSLVAIAALVAVIVVLAKKDDEDIPSGGSAPAFVPRPVEATVVVAEPQQKLDLLRTKLSQFEATQPYLNAIPASAEALASTAATTPEVQAAAWLVHTNQVNEELQLARRFSLAYVYYNNGGPSWTRKMNWLSPTLSHCEWEGVVCCEGHSGVKCSSLPIQAVAEIDLYKNNLVGSIPNSLVLLQELQVIYMSKNALTGEIPGETLSQLPILLKVYLQHNKLSGAVPKALEQLEHLDTLFVQDNDLTGSWPEKLCRSCRDCQDNVQFFGVDCDEVECGACCEHFINCYYDTPAELA